MERDMTKKEIKEKAKEICGAMLVKAQTGLADHKDAHGYTVEVAIEDLDLCNAVVILLRGCEQFSFASVEVNPDAGSSKWKVRALLETNKRPTMNHIKKPIGKKLCMNRACRRVRAELSIKQRRVAEGKVFVDRLCSGLQEARKSETDTNQLLANAQKIHVVELHDLRERMYMRSCTLLFWILGATAAADLVVYYHWFHR